MTTSPTLQRTGAVAADRHALPVLTRHVMIDIGPAHHRLVADPLCDGFLPMHRRPDVADRIRDVFLAAAIPGIVCTPKAPLPVGRIQIGVSFPLREDGVRVRSAVALIITYGVMLVSQNAGIAWGYLTVRAARHRMTRGTF